MERIFHYLILILSLVIYLLSIKGVNQHEKNFKIKKTGCCNIIDIVNYWIVNCHRYYDTDITNNSISFEISRPKSKSGKTYSHIKSIILLDNEIVFEQFSIA